MHLPSASLTRTESAGLATRDLAAEPVPAGSNRLSSTVDGVPRGEQRLVPLLVPHAAVGRDRIHSVDEHTSARVRPPRSVRYRSVASRAAMPAPRSCSAPPIARDRDVDPMSRDQRGGQPAHRAADDGDRGMPALGCRHGLKAARTWPPCPLELEQHPALVHRRVAQRVGRLVARALHPDPVQLVGDRWPRPGRPRRSPPDHGLEAQPVACVLRVHQQERGVRHPAHPAVFLRWVARFSGTVSPS